MLSLPTAIFLFPLKSAVECNFTSSSHRLKFCLSPLPLKHQLSQQEFYDTTITISHCVSLIASIVYLSSFHQKERSKGDERGKRMEGSLQLRGLLSFYLSLSIPWFLNPSCLPCPPPLLAGQALYYSDKSIHVCVGDCVCVLDKDNKKCAQT